MLSMCKWSIRLGTNFKGTPFSLLQLAKCGVLFILSTAITNLFWISAEVLARSILWVTMTFSLTVGKSNPAARLIVLTQTLHGIFSVVENFSTVSITLFFSSIIERIRAVKTLSFIEICNILGFVCSTITAYFTIMIASEGLLVHDKIRQNLTADCFIRNAFRGRSIWRLCL